VAADTILGVLFVMAYAKTKDLQWTP